MCLIPAKYSGVPFLYVEPRPAAVERLHPDLCFDRHIGCVHSDTVPAASALVKFMLRIFRRIRVYLQHDLREIINPTSLPNPPDYIKRPRPTWRKVLTVQSSMQKPCKPTQTLRSMLTCCTGSKISEQGLHKQLESRQGSLSLFTAQYQFS